MSRPARAALGAALVLGNAACALLLAHPASAAPLATPSVSKSTVAWDENFTISGTGCIDPGSGAAGSVAVYGFEFGDGAMASPDGTWSVPGVYRNVPSGTYAFRANCHLPAGTQSYPAFWVTVIAPGVPPAPAPAPAPPPVAAPAPTPWVRPTTPRTPSSSPTPSPVPAPGVAPRVTPTPTRTASPPPATTSPAQAPVTPVSPVPAAGCTDCARVTSEEPLEAGEALSLSWTGFQPGEQVTVVMRSTPVTLGTFTADGAGVVSADVALPEDAEHGAHTLTFSGPLSGDLVALPIRIGAPEVAGVSTTARAPAAAAGVPPWAPVLGGTLVALLTAAGVLLHRRRAASP